MCDRKAICLRDQVVTEIDEADFVLVHGTDALGHPDGPAARSYDELAVILHKVAERAVLPPMIVANPDLVTVNGDQLEKMPGSFGMLYKELGGEVIWMGKPGKAIYEYILQCRNCQPSDLIAIGDSLEHDIKGAAEMGIDSVLVCGGIHAAEVCIDGQTSHHALEKLCSAYNVMPTYYMDAFDNEKL